MDNMSESAEWDALNDRQKEQAESISELAMKFSKFDQSSLADGAHYAPAKLNPFKADGLVCKNCVFFDELTNGCQVVTGVIEPEAICKLWVIPANLISSPNGQVTRDQLATMKPADVMAAQKAGRLDYLLGKQN